jgi:hypothetical protein
MIVASFCSYVDFHLGRSPIDYQKPNPATDKEATELTSGERHIQRNAQSRDRQGNNFSEVNRFFPPISDPTSDLSPKSVAVGNPKMSRIRNQ